MDFSFSPTYDGDIAHYAGFAADEILPRFHALEETGDTPKDLLKKMAEAGLFGISVPTEYGGLGKDHVSEALCIEELSKIGPATAGIINVSTDIVGGSLLRFGTGEQKEKYLTPIAKGEVIGAFALTEPGAGSDASAVRTAARDEGDYWRLNGTKCFITNAEIADTFLIAAMTDMGEGKRKMSMFIVERGTPGFTIGKHEDKMGIRSSSTCELLLEDCAVPKENLLGTLGKGMGIALGGLDGGRVMIAAQALGIAQACWDEAVAWLKANQAQSGGAINRQATQFMLAALQTKIDAARLLTYRAASLWSAGEAFTTQAAMAKYYASDTANEAARACMQVMGLAGAGFGGKVEQFFRDAKITEIYEGTNEIQLMVVANKLGLHA